MLFVLWCYGSKFLPTVISVILSQCISFLSLCPVYMPQNSKCLYIYPDPRDQIWSGWGSKPIVILVVQHFALTLIILHFGNYLHNIMLLQYISTLEFQKLFFICEIKLKAKSCSFASSIFINWNNYDYKFTFVSRFYIYFKLFLFL